MDMLVKLGPQEEKSHLTSVPGRFVLLYRALLYIAKLLAEASESISWLIQLK